MQIEKLRKEDFTTDHIIRGVPTIRFNKNGVVSLSKVAVRHLHLYDEKKKAFSSVSFCTDTDNKRGDEFFVMRDDAGWVLRSGYSGSAVFNSCMLARHVIDKTWGHIGSHPVGEAVPDKYTFQVALRPVDDGKNKNVFALIRKKE